MISSDFGSSDFLAVTRVTSTRGSGDSLMVTRVAPTRESGDSLIIIQVTLAVTLVTRSHFRVTESHLLFIRVTTRDSLRLLQKID